MNKINLQMDHSEYTHIVMNNYMYGVSYITQMMAKKQLSPTNSQHTLPHTEMLL